MIEENLKSFFRLYYSPRAAVGGILDHGTWFFGVAVVVLVAALSHAGTLAGMERVDPLDRAEASQEEPDATDAPSLPGTGWTFWTSAFLSAGLLAIPALALLYLPALILLVSQLEGRGSFGVILRRDYGGLLAFGLMAWAAAHLPFALGRLALSLTKSPHAGALVLLVLPKVYFTLLMGLALNVVFGSSLGKGLLTAAVGWLSLLLTPFLTYLTSPFLLYYLYAYFGGDVHGLASAFRRRQNFRQYLEACTLNPSDAEAHLQLGLIHMERRQYKDAIARFDKAIEIRPDEIDAHYHLGRIAREQGRLQEALSHFDAVAGQDPKFARHEVWRERGLALLAAGRDVEARESLERFVRERPYDPEGLCSLGELYLKLGEADRAREQFEACMEAVRSMPSYRRGETRYWGRSASKALKRIARKARGAMSR